MFERFTDRARRVVVLAQEEARLLHHNYIGTEHILLGLIVEGSGVGAKALEQLGITPAAARAEVTEIIGGRSPGDIPSGHIPFTPRAKQVLELSLREALTLGHNYIGTEHILLGLVREAEGVGAQVLVRLGATLDRVRVTVIELLRGLAAQSSTPTAEASTDPLRYSPGLRYALAVAAAKAAADDVIGTHHVLSVFAERNDLAASRALLSGGFDVANLTVRIDDWNVADTLDETPSQWGMRVTEVEATDDGVVIGLHDEELQARIKAALDAGHGPAVQAMIGEALKQMASKLPPADPSVSEAADASQTAAAGGEEDGDEQDGADENDGGT
jgi:ATP-dependent Clp protease ATP-binding subunit ClpA